jgi:hypothetical protein
MSGNSFPVRVLKIENLSGVGSTGNLRILPANELENLSFVRFFFLDGFDPGEQRGDHAHKECWQLFFNFGGKVNYTFRTIDNQEIAVDSSFPSVILVPPMIWVNVNFIDKDAKILVAATHKFDESDYIRDKREFFL